MIPSFRWDILKWESQFPVWRFQSAKGSHTMQLQLLNSLSPYRSSSECCEQYAIILNHVCNTDRQITTVRNHPLIWLKYFKNGIANLFWQDVEKHFPQLVKRQSDVLSFPVPRSTMCDSQISSMHYFGRVNHTCSHASNKKERWKPLTDLWQFVFAGSFICSRLRSALFTSLGQQEAKTQFMIYRSPNNT